MAKKNKDFSLHQCHVINIFQTDRINRKSEFDTQSFSLRFQSDDNDNLCHSEFVSGIMSRPF